MIDVDVVNGAIAELEAKDMTYSTLEKLSVLYVVRNNNILGAGMEDRSNANITQTIPAVSDSEFIEICKKAEPAVLWGVLDELLLTIQMLYPKLYDETLKQLKYNNK